MLEFLIQMGLCIGISNTQLSCIFRGKKIVALALLTLLLLIWRE
uniref:Uncharacterized protein n=1 Tax=Arundo donax TaxID=35708 RepID=A0A0A9GVK5_ARUDO